VRRTLALLVVLHGLAAPVIAFAQPAPSRAAPIQPGTDPAGPPAPGHRMRQPEMMQHKPSGFRLPNVRAEDGAYRYTLMGIGGGVMVITGILTIRYLRKVSRQRDRASVTASSGSSSAGS
jgi:hypothetical protein